MANFDEVEVAIQYAKGIAWDTCHKIYLLMDNEQVEKMREYGYGDDNDPDSLITREQMTATEMLETVKKWYDDSCGLRFVQSVETNLADPNEGFISLIGQFDDDDEEECEDCLEKGCLGSCYVERCDNCGWEDVVEDGMCKDCYEDSQEEDEDDN